MHSKRSNFVCSLLINSPCKQLEKLNEEITAEKIVKKVDEKTESLMVSLGVDEPLQETEYGMVNPYRTGLSQFLAHEEAKEKEKKEAE